MTAPAYMQFPRGVAALQVSIGPDAVAAELYGPRQAGGHPQLFLRVVMQEKLRQMWEQLLEKMVPFAHILLNQLSFQVQTILLSIGHPLLLIFLPISFSCRMDQ